MPLPSNRKSGRAKEKEKMKKRVLMIVVVFLGFISFAHPAIASLQNGTWSSADGDFNAGLWREILWGGGEGMTGNEIQAWALAPSGLPEWGTYGAVLSTVQDLGGGTYLTTYVGGILFLYKGGPWNPGTIDGSVDLVTMNSFTNTTVKYGDGTMSFDIRGTGTFGEQTIVVAAHFDRATPQGLYPYSGTNPNTGQPGSASFYWGDLTSTTVTISSVPIPPAAWLLGSGLIGLVAIRRRFRNQHSH